jgi:hypothetical protein
MNRKETTEQLKRDREILKYNISITNLQSNLKTEVKNATIPFIKEMLSKMQSNLRTNLADGEYVYGRTTFSNKMRADKDKKML